MTANAKLQSLASSIRIHWQLLLRWILHRWVKTRALPDVDGGMGAAPGKPVCYIFDDYALSSVLILDQVCEQQGLPRPLHAIRRLENTEHRSYAVLRRLQGFLIRRPSTRRSSQVLKRLVEQSYQHPELDIQLVPVTVFVGRAPDKATGLAKILFAEDWQVAGRTRRLFSTMINGRDTLVQFSRPISLRDLVSEDMGAARTLRKVSRILRMHFRRVRSAVIGPDLSHRRMLIDRLVHTPAVREAVAEKSRREKISIDKATREARKYAWEIAADYSYSFIRIASMAIGWFTRRILTGVRMLNFERVKQQALDHEIIYVPCHRSHLDYMLLSYLLHTNGHVPPHIAAGVNLNLPLIGRLMRGGGAFYLRRTFKAQKLYAAVFNEYLSAILAQGVSIEYFIEGTRSRTGRLLQPKAGMLAMTVNGYLHLPVRPVMFQPVYIGYEQVVEGPSYTRELAGTVKRSERLTDLFKVFGVLRNSYGEATVSFGEPIFLDQLLEQYDAQWRETTAYGRDKAPWLPALIDDVGERIMTNINCSADVNPVNLLAMVMLSTPKHALGEKDLLDQLELYQSLMRKGSFSGISVTGKTPAQVVEYGKALGILKEVDHPLGNIITVDPVKAVELTYFRNNVSHLFAVSSLIACCFLNQRNVQTETLERIATDLYPFLKAELFLPWSDAELAGVIRFNMQLLVELGLLSTSEDGSTMFRSMGDTDRAGQLGLLALGSLQTLERYYITVAVLTKNGSGKLSRGQLEKMCILTAQRISQLYGFEAPEFYERNLFRQFIAGMRKTGILGNDEQGRLTFDQSLDHMSEHARYILRKEIRLVIMRIAPHAMIDLEVEDEP